MVSLTYKAAFGFLAFGSIFACSASADVIVSVAGSGNSYDNNQYINYDSGPIARPQTADISGAGEADGTTSSAQASANLVPGLLNPGLRLRTNAKAFGGDVAGTNAWAVAQWGDTIRISPENPLVDHLAVSFSIRGEYGYTNVGRHQLDLTTGLANMSYTTPEGSDPQAFRWAHNVSFFPRPGDSIDPLVSGTAYLSLRRGAWNAAGDLDYVSFDSSTGVASDLYANEPSLAQPSSSIFQEDITGAFGWQQTFYVPYIADLGGYNLNIFAFSGTQAYLGGSAGIDAWNTITLDAVTYVDGSPIAGPIVFDSGFSIASVPEPSSLLIFSSLALLCVAFYRSKQRMVANSA